MQVEYLTFTILLHTKCEQKDKGNQFGTSIIFKNPSKYDFEIKYFLFEKQAFYNESFKVIAYWYTNSKLSIVYFNNIV